MSRYIPFNINHRVRVKLTDHGREIHRKQFEVLFSDDPDMEYRQPDEDADGYSQWQLWDLMNRFGRHVYNGCEPPFETEIQIDTKPQ